MSMDITSPQLHVHLYLWPRVPYGLFLENLHPQGRYCCQHPICQFFSVWTKVSPNARAETWWQQSRYLTTRLWRGSVWFWAKPNVPSTYVAIVLPWWRPYDDFERDNRWCNGSDFDGGDGGGSWASFSRPLTAVRTNQRTDQTDFAFTAAGSSSSHVGCFYYCARMQPHAMQVFPV